MNPVIRLAGVVLVVMLVIGAGALALRPAVTVGPPPTPTIPPLVSPSETLAATLESYRSARNAICTDLNARRVPDATDQADPAAGIAFLRDTINAATEETTRLSALAVPESIRAEHLANIQTVRDTVALLNHEIELLQAGKVDEAHTVDEATGALGTLFEAFETKYRLQDCPYG